MVSALNSALSGFQAASTQLEAHAQNIANQSSTKSVVDGKVVDKPYVPQQVDTISLSSGGVQALTRDANPSAGRSSAFAPPLRWCRRRSLQTTPRPISRR